MEAGTITITGHEGDEIEAYLARPPGGAPYGGVVVIHHLPGYDAGDEGDRAPVRGQRVRGDVPEPLLPRGARREPGRRGRRRARAGRHPGRAARRRRRTAPPAPAGLPDANGKVGVIGHCSGGRQAFLAACSLPLDAAVDCYGAFVVDEPPAEFPLHGQAAARLAAELSCPLLGLFGADDKLPVARGDRHARRRARPAGQAARVPHLRRRRPRVLLRRPARLPARGRGRRLGSRIFAFFGRHLAA